MKKILKFLGIGLGVLLVAVIGIYAWASSTTADLLAVEYETHRVELAVPMPLSPDEIAAIREERLAAIAGAELVASVGAGVPAVPVPGTEVAEPIDPLAGVDLDKIALDRAVERGKHLVSARFVCVECHGADFGGGTMVDDPAMGAWHGPNLTTGKGSVTLAYTSADWDRIVRHGVRGDGTAAVMPSDDFVGMSDRELSDIVTYIRAQPAVDKQMAPRTIGPISTMLLATGKLPLAANHVQADASHPLLPPDVSDPIAFGKHLSQICTGCHGAGLNGGPIAAGPPDWPAARNLTPSADGLKGWTYEQFDAALRQGLRPDGTALLMPMSLVTPYANNMTEAERRALWQYIESLPPLATGA